MTTSTLCLSIGSIELFLQWSYTNCDHLYSLLSEEDKVTFDFDISKLDWKKYVDVFTLGTKMYLLKEDPANIPKARKRITRYINVTQRNTLR